MIIPFLSARRRASRSPAPGNLPAAIFRTLYLAWHRDAASDLVDRLAAELAALTAQARAPLCLGLIRREAVPSYYGLVFLLDSYGLVLRKRYRADGSGAYVFLELKGGAPSEFAGTTVEERTAEDGPAFARAA